MKKNLLILSSVCIVTLIIVVGILYGIGILRYAPISETVYVHSGNASTRIKETIDSTFVDKQVFYLDDLKNIQSIFQQERAELSDDDCKEIVEYLSSIVVPLIDTSIRSEFSKSDCSNSTIRKHTEGIDIIRGLNPTLTDDNRLATIDSIYYIYNRAYQLRKHDSHKDDDHPNVIVITYQGKQYSIKNKKEAKAAESSIKKIINTEMKSIQGSTHYDNIKNIEEIRAEEILNHVTSDFKGKK